MNKFILTPAKGSLVGSFENYKMYARSIPDLSAEDERRLVEKLNYYTNQQDSMEAAKKLVLSQIKNVVRIAEQHKGYGIPTEDLVQEGNIGLMKAVKSYQPTFNTRLYTYAIIWIKSEIQSYILKNWKIVKAATTNSLKKLFFNFRSTQNELVNSGVPQDEVLANMAKRLDVSEEDAREMQNYLMGSDVSLDVEYDDGEGDKGTLLQLPDYRTPEKIYQKKNDELKRSESLRKHLNILNDKQRMVIEMKYLNDDEESPTNKDVAQVMGVSAERVRQLESESLSKLRTLMLK